MSVDEFRIGGVYLAIPAIAENPRKVAVVIGRQGRRVQFAWVDGISTALAEVPFNREYCTVERSDGTFGLSCAQQIDTYTTAEVVEILTKGRV